MPHACALDSVVEKSTEIATETRDAADDLIGDILGDDVSFEQCTVDLGKELKPWQVALGRWGFKLLESYTKLKALAQRMWQKIGNNPDVQN